MSEENEQESQGTDARRAKESADILNAQSESSEEVVSATPMLTRAVALLPLLLFFIGAGRSPWTLGLMAVAVGGLVLRYPAQAKIPYALLVVMASIAVLTLLPLIPIPVPFPPAWRAHLIDDVGVKLGTFWSVQPLVTLESWLCMMVIMVWFAWLVSQDRVTEQRSQIQRIIASGVAWLAVLSLIFFFIGWRPASWGLASRQDIGPFANRTHFSTLMSMNAILCLACAYDLLRRKKTRWVLYAMCLVPCFAVVLVNTSRVGLLLFFAGVLMWFLAAALRKKSLKRLAIGGALLLACTTGTVLFAQQLLGRFSTSEQSVIERFSEDGRFPLYLDTLELILQHPVLGVGLGNFAGVFGMTNQLAEPFVRFNHPESDLLWFIAEAGWPAAMAVLMGLLLFLRWIGPWKVGSKGPRRRERRLRLAAGMAVLIALGHGLVDTPGHGMAMAMLIALLAALALYGTKLSQSRGVLISGLLKTGGMLSLLAGGAWLLTGAGFNTPMGESVRDRDMAKARAASDAEVASACWPVVQNAIRAAPIHWEAYFYRASIGLRMGRPFVEVMEDFGRARYLEPNVAHICMAEANVWLRHQPLFAVPAWREALRRDHIEGLNRYREMLDAAKQFPELRSPVRALAIDARLLLAYLSSCTADHEVREVQAELLARFPTLEGLNKYERNQFFGIWRSRGDRPALVAALESHASWLEDGWSVLAQEYASDGKSQKAYELVMMHVTPPATMTPDSTSSIEALQRDFSFNPSDAKRGFTLAMAQRDKLHLSDALGTLEKIALQPTAPKNVYYEMAKVHAKMNNYVKAWESLSRYLQL